MVWLAAKVGYVANSWRGDSEGENGRLFCLLCVGNSMPILIVFLGIYGAIFLGQKVNFIDHKLSARQSNYW